MRSNPSAVETALAAAALMLLGVAAFGPAIAQPAAYHAFADQRTLWQLPFAMDMLSNLPFALAGIAGLRVLRALPPRAISNMQHAMATLFFAGLLFTAAGSAWYHAHPDDASLVVDRDGIAIAFAGLLGLAVATQVSERAAAVAGLAMLLLGPLAVQQWASTANLLPWVCLQGGGMAVLAFLALLRPRRGAPHIRWSLVILAYVAAKGLEFEDHGVFALTGGLVAGHTLKHLLAAAAAVPVIAALGALRPHRQNRLMRTDTLGSA